MSRYLLILSLILLRFTVEAQNIEYARSIIDTLSSPGFHGRGYVNGGETKAAVFIADEFRKAGMQKLGPGYYQHFSIPVNTLPGVCNVWIDGEEIMAGNDFFISASCPSANASFDIHPLSRGAYNSENEFQAFCKGNHNGAFVMINDSLCGKDNKWIDLRAMRNDNPFGSEGIIFLRNKPHYWHVSGSGKVGEHIIIDIQKEVISDDCKKIKVLVENKYYPFYLTQNVIGFLPGTSKADSFLVFTAHYDHLGRMGKDVYFPGAHDNASGTAMIIDLARQYAADTVIEYSMLFIAFGAEETGLHGSEFFVKHPVIPLDRIRCLVNLDLIGSGSKGITVVNGSVFTGEFERLENINKEKNYLSNIKSRGEAANSDHYHFSEKGVPSFFIYTMGDEYKEYHTIDDKAEGLPLTVYDELFLLLREFAASF